MIDHGDRRHYKAKPPVEYCSHASRSLSDTVLFVAILVEFGIDVSADRVYGTEKHIRVFLCAQEPARLLSAKTRTCSKTAQISAATRLRVGNPRLLFKINEVGHGFETVDASRCLNYHIARLRTH